MSPDQLFQLDVQQMFLDWGQPAQLRERRRQFDAESGLLVETKYPVPITVIPLEETPHPVTKMAASLNRTHRQFLVCESELPVGVELSSAQLGWKGLDFEVRSWSRSGQSDLLTLECVTDASPDWGEGHVH